MLTDEDKKQALQAFDDIDERRSGTIPNTKESLIEAVRLAGLNPTERETAKYYQDTVADYGETLTKEQFLEFVTQFDWNSREGMKDILKQDFEMFDTNKNGALGQDELINILTREGREFIRADQVETVVKDLHKDKNGNINIEELIDMMLSD